MYLPGTIILVKPRFVPIPNISSYGQNLKLLIDFPILCLRYGLLVVCEQQLLENNTYHYC